MPSPRLVLLLLAPLAPAAALAQSTQLVTSGANAECRLCDVSDDARQVLFGSPATNLLPPDANGNANDLYLVDRVSGSLVLVSADSAGVRGNDRSLDGTMSPDARWVAFQSHASNLVPADTNGKPDVFVRDLQTGTTACVSVTPSGAVGNDRSSEIGISDDGRYVAFWSRASDLVANDLNGEGDVFVRDTWTGTTVCANVDPVLGTPASGGAGVTGALSASGTCVAFESLSGSLVPGDANARVDVFVRDLALGTTERVSIGTDASEGTFDSLRPALSRTGVFVLFDTRSYLDPTDQNGIPDVYFRDRAHGTTTKISRSATGGYTDFDSFAASFSADARFVVFESRATNIVVPDHNGLLNDAYLFDRATGTTIRADVDSTGQNVTGDFATHVRTAGGGRYVFFETDGSFESGENDLGQVDVFVRDRGPLPPLPATYCTGKTNSLGCTPAMSASGAPTVSGYDAFSVHAASELNHRAGLLFWGLASASAPFAGGTLCIAGALTRTPLQDSGGNPGPDDCSGSYSFAFTQAYMAAHGLAAGTSVFCQFFGRDAGSPPSNLSLSDALSFTVLP